MLNIFDDKATLVRWTRDSITVSLNAPVETPMGGGIGVDPATLSSPTRARVWAPDFHLEGTKVELFMDGSGVMQVRSKNFALEMPASAITRIQILDGGQAVTMPLSSVYSIAVYEGRKSGARTGAGIGFLLGAAGGVALVKGMSCIMSCTPVSTGAFAIGAIVGGGVGAGLGAIIGSAITWDGWEEVPIYRVRVAPIVRGTEFGFAASVRF